MQPTMIKALFCASLALVPSVAIARHADTRPSAITVTAGSDSLRQWSRRVSQDLNANLEYPSRIGRDDYPQGAVRVAFHCSESGQPDGVSVVQSSRSVSLDRAAVHAVKRIPTLHPLPDGIGHDRSMEAWVFFAPDQRTADKMKAGFARQAQIAANQPHPADQQASLPPLVFASR